MMGEEVISAESGPRRGMLKGNSFIPETKRSGRGRGRGLQQNYPILGHPTGDLGLTPGLPGREKP